MSNTEYCITQLTVDGDNTENMALHQYEYIIINNPEEKAILVG